MNTIEIQCPCGAVALRLEGKPLLQYFCHCDDCQAVHGARYAVSLYPADSVRVTRGETDDLTRRDTPRTRCRQCGTFVFAKVSGYAGANGDLMPAGSFIPEFHIQCRYASAPIPDSLPHYKGRPARFGGSDELMAW